MLQRLGDHAWAGLGFKPLVLGRQHCDLLKQRSPPERRAFGRVAVGVEGGGSGVLATVLVDFEVNKCYASAVVQKIIGGKNGLAGFIHRSCKRLNA